MNEALVPREEQPYEVPENWIWVKLGGVIDVNPPKLKMTSLTDEDRCSFVPMAAVSDTDGVIFAPEERGFKQVKTGYTQFVEEDVIFAKITPCMENGKSAIAKDLINGVGYGSTEFYVLRTSELLENKLLYQLVRSSSFRAEAKRHMTGAVGQQRVPKKFIEDYPFPLPPLNEQKRIADKVERLLDKINQAKQLIEEAKATFELRRAAILDKAFRGELTKKWREENQDKLIHGAELYHLIKNNRLENVESKRELKEVSQMFEDSNLQELIDANGWIHLKANMFCLNINCGRTPTEDISESGEVPFLKVYNIVNNKIDFEYKPQFIPKEVSDSNLEKSKLLPNDIIMNIVGPPLKKIAVIPNDYPEWNMNQAIVRFRPLNYVLTKYLYYCLQFDETLKEVINQTRGVVGQSNISVNQSRSLSMPIPSVEEQHEIVNALEKLIEKEIVVLDILNSKEDELDKLTQSILNKAFKGSLGTGNTEEGPAINLLIPSL